MPPLLIFVAAITSSPLIAIQAKNQDHESAQTATSTAEYVDQIFTFDAGDGSVLEAKLSLPVKHEGPVPCVFYLHGAGPRAYDNPFLYRETDGSVQTGQYLDFYAAELARAGVGFCRMSKRGCTPKPPPATMDIDRAIFATATPSVLVADYEACLSALRARPEVDARRLVLMGSSEGTMLAPQVFQRSPAGIRGLVLLGYAADNARDTVVWQNSVGPWRNVQHLVPAALDGALTKEEYDAAVASKPTIGQQLPFAVFDADQDGSITPSDMVTVVEPRLTAILKAVEEADDGFLQTTLLGLSSAYLYEWWETEPNSARLLQVDVPIGIFHGGLDGACRVEGVRETEEAFRAAKKTNLVVHVYPTADHDLDWSWPAARDEVPEAFRDAFAFAVECVRAPQGK